ncbi:protein of unknown function DUF404 [Planctopirus limnophila DSM 3776]|uniref:Uncharacterized protein n=1 Tax=Planctopirus limnophila (strain ATCC 43296 / DSM 3776 / IFAM 1008 / Mu 290) TaxID=521674 RepID=D5SW43_PLAL2|nr:circularly permuted type 2 ATP-grasp protein [Planctopirus limnophila]ADG67328.1 protein of unknown function DUF404 [Planctopirus limnophila DSM 3776]
MTQAPGTVLRTGLAEGLVESYPVAEGTHDEYFMSRGVLRAHTTSLVDAIQEMGPLELLRSRQQAQRTIHENSVTYTAQGDTERRNRPWEFDVIPLIIPPDQWQKLARGLSQRAYLLNMIIRDLYGEQRLLSERLLPPQLVYSNPHYSRALHDLPAPVQHQWLQLYAGELARNPGGDWVIVSDRTEAPSGVAYALENRIVGSSIFPKVFRDQRVQRLAPFFIALRELLQKMAYDHRDNPRIVLLSQGPSNPNFFEDAYLARYLGYSLVEGEDLAVRDQQVMLKTLGGLLPVDVLFRRLDDLDCDPLELKADSFRGVTGLVQALRARQCAVANALGCSLLETPAIMAYLPQIARNWLGTELDLPSTQTWWCGDPKSLEYVRQHANSLWIRPAFSHSNLPSGRPAELSQSQRDTLLAAMNHRPHLYVGQEIVRRSKAPVLLNDSWQSWHVGLRTYLVASNSGYVAMPGGLVRCSPSSHTIDQSVSLGEGAKDCWVQSDGPVPQITLLSPPGAAITLRRSGSELPSRVADNMFWVGRFAERAESTARLLRTMVSRLTGESGGSNVPDVAVLMRCLAEGGQIEPSFALQDFRQHMPAIESLLPPAIFDEREPFSLKSTLSQLNHVASLVRERLSLDSWRTINRLYREFHRRRTNAATDFADVLQQLNRLIGDLSALSGLSMESTTRTLGWRFLDIGRRIERSMQTLVLGRSLLIPEYMNSSAVLESIVEVADSLITYRTRYLTRIQLPPVLDLILTDESNPRSVIFQMQTLSQHIDQLPRDKTTPLRTTEQRLILNANSLLQLISAEELSSANQPDVRDRIDRRLAKLARILPQLSNAITHRYLLHAVSAQQLTDVRPRKLKPAEWNMNTTSREKTNEREKMIERERRSLEDNDFMLDNESL